MMFDDVESLEERYIAPDQFIISYAASLDILHKRFRNCVLTLSMMESAYPELISVEQDNISKTLMELSKNFENATLFIKEAKILLQQLNPDERDGLTTQEIMRRDVEPKMLVAENLCHIIWEVEELLLSLGEVTDLAMGIY